MKDMTLKEMVSDYEGYTYAKSKITAVTVLGNGTIKYISTNEGGNLKPNEVKAMLNYYKTQGVFLSDPESLGDALDEAEQNQGVDNWSDMNCPSDNS